MDALRLRTPPSHLSVGRIHFVAHLPRKVVGTDLPRHLPSTPLPASSKRLRSTPRGCTQDVPIDACSECEEDDVTASGDGQALPPSSSPLPVPAAPSALPPRRSASSPSTVPPSIPGDSDARPDMFSSVPGSPTVVVLASRAAVSSLASALDDAAPPGRRLPASASTRLRDVRRLLSSFDVASLPPDTDACGLTLGMVKPAIAVPAPHLPRPFGRTKYLGPLGDVNTLLRTPALVRTFLLGEHYHEFDLSRAHVTLAAGTYRLVRPTAVNETCDKLLDPVKRASLEHHFREELVRSRARLQADLDNAVAGAVSTRGQRVAVARKRLAKAYMEPKHAFSAILYAPDDGTWANAFPAAHAPLVYRVNRDIRQMLATLPSHPHCAPLAHALASPAGKAAQPADTRRRHLARLQCHCLHELEDLAVAAMRSYFASRGVTTSASINDSLLVSASDCALIEGGLASLDPSAAICAALGFPLSSSMSLSMLDGASAPPALPDVVAAVLGVGSPAPDSAPLGGDGHAPAVAPPDSADIAVLHSSSFLPASAPSTPPSTPLPPLPDSGASPALPVPGSAPQPHASSASVPHVRCPCLGCDALDFGPADVDASWLAQRAHLYTQHSRGTSSFGVDGAAALAAGCAACPICSKLVNFVHLGGAQPRSQFAVHLTRGRKADAGGCGSQLPDRYSVANRLRELQASLPLGSAADCWLSLRVPRCPRASPHQAAAVASLATTPTYSPPPIGRSVPPVGSAPHASEFMSDHSAYDWSWLRDVSMADLAALDVTVPKFPPSSARGAHADTLAFGLRYLSSHVSADTSHLGFRYMAVANMVLLGYPRGSDSRPTAAQVRERADRVRSGDLRRMWEDLRATCSLPASSPPPSPPRAPDATDEEATGPTLDADLPEASPRLLRRMMFLCGMGHLAKAYAACGRSPVVDLHLPQHAEAAHKLHPRADIPDPLSSAPDTPLAVTPRDVFDAVFRSPPTARAAGPSSLTFEVLSSVYRRSSVCADDLYTVVCRINDGSAHSSLFADLTVSSLTGLQKPDNGGIRPIAIGDALARLSSRCTCRALSEVFQEHFTAPMSSAAAGGRRPLQLGVGVSGGAEVIVHSLRLLLERNPHWACVGNDLRNGFNAISREKAVQAIHDNPLFAPYLPFVQQSYLREAPLLARGKPIQAAGQPRPVDSSQGVRQGDPFAPALFALALHPVLQRVQEKFPDVYIFSYLDDTYMLGPPQRAWDAARLFHTLCKTELCLEARTDKMDVYCPFATSAYHEDAAADMPPAPAPDAPELTLPFLHDFPDVRGSPWHAKPEHRYALGFKCMGAFIGQPHWVAQRTRSALEAHLEPLTVVTQLGDVEHLRNSLQCKLLLMRWCSSAGANHWLRLTPPSVMLQTSDVDGLSAASSHDALLDAALATSLEIDEHSPRGQHALTQARLPLALSGLGLPSAVALSEPAFLASLASVWHHIVRFIPDLASIDFASDEAEGLPSLRDARYTHARLESVHLLLARRYAEAKADPASAPKFAPRGLPPSLPSLSSFAASAPHKAQTAFSAVVHHYAWSRLLEDASADGGDREAVRLISVSQPGATDFHRCLPSRSDFVIESEVMLVATQRQLGLPLSCLQGLDVDPLGDASINSHTDHTTRHNRLLLQWVVLLKRAHRHRSVVTSGPAVSLADDCIADAAVLDFHGPGCNLIIENKLVSPLHGDGTAFDPAACRSAFAGSAPRMASFIHTKYDGRLGRHRKTDLIHEVFGGTAPPGVSLLKRCARMMRGRDLPGLDSADPLFPDFAESVSPSSMSSSDIPWAARSFLPYALQTLSRSIHSTVADQILDHARALRGARHFA